MNIIKFYPKDAAENPDNVLEQAVGQYQSLILIGYNKDDELDVRSTTNLSYGDVNMMVDLFKHKLLNGDYSE